MTDRIMALGEDHPSSCPWCGRDRIRGILPSPDGNRWYRCVSCATTFYIQVTSQSAERDAPLHVSGVTDAASR